MSAESAGKSPRHQQGDLCAPYLEGPAELA